MIQTQLTVFFAAAICAIAQTTTFDAVSIRPTKVEGGANSIRATTGRISMSNVNARKVILNAYGILDDREYAIIGPDWLGTERFDIEATYPPDTPVAKLLEMLQAMLKERFQMALHRETRQLPMYSLVIAKGGPKIHAVTDGQGRTSGRPGHLELTKTTMRKFADLIGRQAGVPVTDATGLEGVFDFTLEWSPSAGMRVEPSDVAPHTGEGPSIFTAIQEQLGLKLESVKGPVEVLVIDKMERTPTAN